MLAGLSSTGLVGGGIVKGLVGAGDDSDLANSLAGTLGVALAVDVFSTGADFGAAIVGFVAGIASARSCGDKPVAPDPSPAPGFDRASYRSAG